MVEGGNRHQTISTDHHNVGGSTTVLLEEHRIRQICEGLPPHMSHNMGPEHVPLLSSMDA